MFLNSTIPVGAKVRFSFEPQSEALGGASQCNVTAPTERRDCGFSGITQSQCEDKGCCYHAVTPNPQHIPFCFHPPPAPPSNITTVTVDLVDFYLVDDPFPAPSEGSYVNVLDHGADATGSIDSLQAFEAAVANASSNHLSVWVPPGTFLLSDHVVLEDNVTLHGAGPFYSKLVGTPQVEGSKQSVGVYGRR